MDAAVVDATGHGNAQIDAAQVIPGDGLDGFYVEGFKDGAN